MARIPRAIDPARLRKLRELILSAQPDLGSGLPLDSLAALAEESAELGRVTIDYRAAEDLGFPMVVLHGDSPEPTVDLDLSPREVQVAKLIADGLSNKEIAVRLGISLLTVKDHVHRILEKTGFPNRAAVAAAIRG